MKLNNVDGKTFYYLIDKNKVAHICSDGLTNCGLDAKEFYAVADDKLDRYTMCKICPTIRKASFETKAEIVDTTGTFI
jgi:hypothetical protein